MRHDSAEGHPPPATAPGTVLPPGSTVRTAKTTTRLAHRRARAGGADRQLILRAAAEIIAQRGLDQTRYSDVSDRTGVPISTLQYRFGSLKDLLVAAFDFVSTEELAALERAVAAEADPLRQVHMLSEYGVGIGENRDSWLLWLEFWRAAARDEELNARSQEVQETWRAAMAAAVHRGVKAGIFRPDIDPAQAAILMLAIIDGVSLALIVATPDSNAELARRLVREGIERLVLA